MEINIRFSHNFTRRMLALAVITAFLITVSMPITFLVLSRSKEKWEAANISQQLALQLRESVKENPELWQYNVQKFANLVSAFKKKDISTVKIFDDQFNLSHQETLSKPSFLDVKGSSKVVFNNKVYGYIEVSKVTLDETSMALALLLAFGLLGLLVGTVLYRFPVKIVRQSEREVTQAFKRLEFLSYHDSLTKLPNRVKFSQQLSKGLKNAQLNQYKLAVLFMDLDRFKIINDTFGHKKGDMLLKLVAEKLSDSIKSDITIARLGGDEFTLILPVISHTSEAALLAQKIIDILAQPFMLDGHEFFISTSIGISIYPEDGQNAETLVKKADTAMYQAKNDGKNKFQFYSPNMDIATMERLTLENNLHRALHTEEIVVYFQPIIDIETGKFSGIEALARWLHPEKELLTPNLFIPIAEETGLIVPLGARVLRIACAQTQKWRQAGFDIYVSVNLSARQLQQPNFIPEITSILAETGLAPQFLQLEITESVAMKNENTVVNNLKALENLRIRIAIDDFGTGYSSLSSIKNLPIQTLKIDKTFIHNLTSNSQDSGITKTIINMALSLGLNVTAEGVESKEQLAFLRKNHCSEVQGYLFSKPVPAEELEKLLTGE